MMRGVCVLAGAAWLASVASGAVINVPANLPTIQGAINVAADGDEIVVAPGTYNQNIDFLGKAITVRSSNGAAATTISAGGTVVTCDDFEGADTVLDGFTITGGNAIEGGGMRAAFSHPTIANCIFDNNDATRGGAIHIVGSTASFTTCTFTSNSATDSGGAVYCNASSPLFTDCDFSGNTVSGGLGDGGALYNTNFSNSIVVGCTFQSNSAPNRGGAIANTAFSDTTFESCVLDMNSAQRRGGAMYNESSSPTLADCTFSNNTAGSPNLDGAVAFGGAVYNVAGSPTFLACQFVGNIADALQIACCSSSRGHGGAMYSSGGGPTLTDCTFLGNLAIADSDGGFTHSLGGAVYSESSNLSISGCLFDGNIVDGSGGSGYSDRGRGGALFNTGSSTITISSTAFTANEARGGASGDSRGLGGAIYSVSGALLQIDDSTFTGNVADNGSGSGPTRALGGAIYLSGTSGLSELVNCTFDGNLADVNGGAIYHHGSGSNGETLRVVRSTFSDNLSVLGSSVFLVDAFSGERIISCEFLGNITGVSGGIYNDDSSPSVVNCLFSGNSASSFGGGVFNFDNSDPAVTNCTFSENTAFAGAAIHNFSSASNPTIANCIVWGNSNMSGLSIAGNGTPTVSYSDVEGGIAGTANINTEPMFVDPDGADDVPGTDDDDLHLVFGSLCMETGNNAALPADTADLDGDGNTTEPVSVDLDGNARIANGDLAGPATVDMGAYERPAPPLPANDSCASAQPISDGTVAFWTVGATTDGTATICDGGVGSSFLNDVWYVYTASCTGTATVSTCNDAGFDTRLAVYAVASCPPASPLACSDNAPGCGLTSEVQLAVLQGVPYIVRVGATQGSGFGNLTVSCQAAADPCPWDINDNGVVGTPDFLAVLGAWGPNPGHPADFNGDGVVGTPDFLALLAHWGPCP